MRVLIEIWGYAADLNIGPTGDDLNDLGSTDALVELADQDAAPMMGFTQKR